MAGVVNTVQAEVWNGYEGEHWAAHDDRYDAVIGVCHETVLSLLFHGAGTPPAPPAPPEAIDAWSPARSRAEAEPVAGQTVAYACGICGPADGSAAVRWLPHLVPSTSGEVMFN
jgi:hypothetical protein